MRKNFQSRPNIQLGIFLVLAFLVASFSIYSLTGRVTATEGEESPVSVDIRANDSDGPVVLGPGDTYTYSWDSLNAAFCTLDNQSGESGISLAGVSSTIDSTHPWYPTASSPVTLTFNCINSSSSDSDSVIIELA